MTTSLPLPMTVISSAGNSCLILLFQRVQVAANLHFEGLDRACLVPDEQGDRSRLLAVNQQLRWRGHQRVGDVRNRQRDARNRGPDVEQRGATDQQVDLGTVGRLANRWRRGDAARRVGRLLLRRGRSNEDHDDVHDQRRKEGRRPAASMPRSPELSRACRDHVGSSECLSHSAFR